jgi:hypothetical protein
VDPICFISDIRRTKESFSNETRTQQEVLCVASFLQQQGDLWISTDRAMTSLEFLALAVFGGEGEAGGPRGTVQRGKRGKHGTDRRVK